MKEIKKLSREIVSVSRMSVVTGAAAARPTASAYSIFFSQGADAPWKKKSSGRESVSVSRMIAVSRVGAARPIGLRWRDFFSLTRCWRTL